MMQQIVQQLLSQEQKDFNFEVLKELTKKD